MEGVEVYYKECSEKHEDDCEIVIRNVEMGMVCRFFNIRVGSRFGFCQARGILGSGGIRTNDYRFTYRELSGIASFWGTDIMNYIHLGRRSFIFIDRTVESWDRYVEVDREFRLFWICLINLGLLNFSLEFSYCFGKEKIVDFECLNVFDLLDNYRRMVNLTKSLNLVDRNSESKELVNDFCEMLKVYGKVMGWEEE